MKTLFSSILVSALLAGTLLAASIDGAARRIAGESNEYAARLAQQHPGRFGSFAMLPMQDTGQLAGFIRGDDGLSFQVMQPKMEIFRRAVLEDPAVHSVAGFIGLASPVRDLAPFLIAHLGTTAAGRAATWGSPSWRFA